MTFKNQSEELFEFICDRPDFDCTCHIGGSIQILTTTVEQVDTIVPQWPWFIVFVIVVAHGRIGAKGGDSFKTRFNIKRLFTP